MSLRSLMIFLLGLLALVMLSFICLGYHAPAIEQDLAERSRASLAAQGIGWAEVSVDGQTVTIAGKPPSTTEQLKAEKVVSGVWGVASVTANLTDGVTETTPYEFGLEYVDGQVTLRGNVPDETTRSGLTALLSGSITEGREVVDNLQIREDAPRGFVDALLHHILPSLVDFRQASITFDHNLFRIDGLAGSELKRYDIERRLQNVGAPDLGVELSISAPVYEAANPPEEPSPAADTPPPGLEPMAAEVDNTEAPPVDNDIPTASTDNPEPLDDSACQDRFAELLESQTVQFDFKDETVTPEGETLLQEVAALIQRCPRVRLEVGGHTDWKGPGKVNERLSLRRARAVREHLIELGAAADQLTAKGYGESEPLAENDTAEGRALNRRVEIIVLDQ